MDAYWGTMKEVQRIVGCSRYAVEKMADVGAIRTIVLPGCERRKFCLKDARERVEELQGNRVTELKREEKNGHKEAQKAQGQKRRICG